MARLGPMEPGARDRAVTIQSRPSADAVETSGFPKDTWSDLATNIFMSKREANARERFTANQLSASFDAVFEMGYRDDMDPELVDVPKLRRLIYQGRVYDIVAANPINRREGVELFTLASTRI